MTINLHSNKKSIRIYISIGLFFSILIATYFILKPQKLIEPKITYADCNHVLYANAPITPSKVLNDKNDIHLLHAQKNGLKKPFETNEEFEKDIKELAGNNILMEVTDNDNYKIKKLKHSHPYLIPEAVEMINEIAGRFNEKIKEYKVDNYRIMLTSVLRTEETQNKLSKRNSNASNHSAHLYGTTIDISYKDFYNVDKDTVEGKWEAIQALTKVLVEMREECKIVGVRERKQSCFHLTVVVCDPTLKKSLKEESEENKKTSQN